ncbi:MAG: hypothetical protein QXI13_02180 [Thermoplasmatales archaeon]
MKNVSNRRNTKDTEHLEIQYIGSTNKIRPKDRDAMIQEQGIRF